jgi:hypothetical protein
VKGKFFAFFFARCRFLDYVMFEPPEFVKFTLRTLQCPHLRY